MAVGRPRSFDRDEALKRALEVFWRKGYEAAALSDLTAAMRINPPSLYATFGNKEGLFREALELYAKGRDEVLRQALKAPRARDAIAELLHALADSLSDKNNPQGCFLVRSVNGCESCSDEMKEEILSLRGASEAAIRTRLRRAKKEKDLPASSDPTLLARYVSTIMQGLGVQAAAGTSRKGLHDIVDVALTAFP